MSFIWKSASRSVAPLASIAFLSSGFPNQRHHEATRQHQQEEGAGGRTGFFSVTLCEEGAASPKAHVVDGKINGTESLEGMNVRRKTKTVQPEEELYHGLFPKRQLWKPPLEYPLWFKNWDGREPEPTGNKEEDHIRARHIRKHGVTRHIILVRHGQYDETDKEDERRVLTPLGIQQAELTGKRLAEMIQGSAQDATFSPCNVTKLRVSGMTRAKQTADIIAKYLPGVERVDPDPGLNEGRPCHHIPSGRVTSKVIQATDDGHKRIESSFQKLFYRAPFENSFEGETNPEKENKVCKESSESEKHEFEVIVCHANVIRYFLMRFRLKLGYATVPSTVR